MGQYWLPVNLDKREFILPHRLATGLTLWEQLATHPGTGAALIVLCAAMPEARGGGDFAIDPEDSDEAYSAIARRTVGRWAGDRIALIGDYAHESDLPAEFHAARIYALCGEDALGTPEAYTDISDDVCAVIAHELEGTYKGDGWREFIPNR